MRNKSIILFGKKVLIFILILLSIDFAVGKVMEKYFLRIKGGETGRGIYAFNEAKEDIIILGSSRANHHYVSQMMQDSLKMTCYNAGRDGQGILYNSALLKVLIARKPPKLVVFDLNTSEFTGEGYDRIALLSPFSNLHPEIRSVLSLRGTFEQLKQLSSAYRYNSLLITIVANNILKRDDNTIAGYIPLTGAVKTTPANYPDAENATPLDTLKLNQFRQLIADVKAANTKLVVCVSPIYMKISNGNTPSMEAAAKICDQNNIPFLNDAQLGEFLQDGTLFTDTRHLNDSGAHKFSALFLEQIRTKL